MMNYDQSLEVAAGNKRKMYAMVGGLYVTGVSNLTDELALSTRYRKAKTVFKPEHLNWLRENVKDVQFYEIQLQAQSVPVEFTNLVHGNTKGEF
ncbi:hypothetical protein 056SW001B_76 [Bacillus phage 056SW001B]|uniref:Uncharacterized protein n=1 Tax=Bacillus phage 056SW001B TaxID=2601663 RepID=A0A5P8PKH4_9CAUD|nr:hypothetical protein 056SW001B_76 [Bacillus phage 056SW001B]